MVTVDEGVPQPFPWTDLPHRHAYAARPRKAISQAGKLRYAAPGNPIRVAEPAFALADTATLAAMTDDTCGGDNLQRRRGLTERGDRAAPSERDMLQIVATHELIR